jgi:hypothetical protein
MTVNDLVREAMLNPALARQLVARVPSGKAVGPLRQRRIARALQATVAGNAVLQQQQQAVQ